MWQNCGGDYRLLSLGETPAWCRVDSNYSNSESLPGRGSEKAANPPAWRDTCCRWKLDIPVGVVQRGRRSGRLNKKPKSAPHSLNSQPTTCTRCGRTPLHDRRLCPASNAICHKCSKWGHFQVVCHSTVKVGEVNQEDPNEFLGVVDTRDTVSNMWRLSLLLNGVHTEFDIDTGAKVSMISESQHQRIGSLLLSPPGKRLRGLSNYSLPVTGCFTGVLKHGSQKCSRKSMV